METLNATLPKGRTLPINGDAVRTLRVERRWDAAQLARKVGCSVKNIQNIERGGKRVYAITLAAIADALEVSNTALLAGPIPNHSEPQGRRISGVSVQFTLNFLNINASDDLIALLEKFATTFGATSEIQVLSVKDGSLTVTLDMSEEDALKLIAACNSSVAKEKLDELRLSRIELAPSAAMHRMAQAYDQLKTSDLRATEYEKSNLFKLGLKDVWYLLKIAHAQNQIKMGSTQVKDAEATYQRLVAEAAADGLEPTPEELFAARLLDLFLWDRHHMPIPKVDDRGGLVIPRDLPELEQDNEDETLAIRRSEEDSPDGG